MTTHTRAPPRTVYSEGLYTYHQYIWGVFASYNRSVPSACTGKIAVSYMSRFVLFWRRRRSRRHASDGEVIREEGDITWTEGCSALQTAFPVFVPTSSASLILLVTLQKCTVELAYKWVTAQPICKYHEIWKVGHQDQWCMIQVVCNTGSTYQFNLCKGSSA